MLLLRDLTDGVDYLEELVMNNSSPDHVNDFKKQLLAKFGDFLSSQAKKYTCEVIKEFWTRASRLGLSMSCGQFSVLLPAEVDENGEVIFERAVIHLPN